MTRSASLAETAGAMKVVDEFEPDAVIGPLIDMKAVEKVEAHIADALKTTGNESQAWGGRAQLCGGTKASMSAWM
jgi:succinate-semialdehyde dehydrogenase/glutarate-semialdehyde dehydrogenase